MVSSCSNDVSVGSSASNGPLADEGGRTARSTPTIESSLISVRQANDAGFGVFAGKDLAPCTDLLRSSSPAAYVVYRQFRKEVCAWCFRYERGRTWKIRFSESDIDKCGEGSLEEAGSTKSGSLQRLRARNGPLNGGGLVFDSESCKRNWLEEYGFIGLECFVAVEAFVQRKSRRKDEPSAEGEGEPNRPPTQNEIDLAWESIGEEASNIRDHRLSSSTRHRGSSTKAKNPLVINNSNHQHWNSVHTKNGARVIAEALQHPIRDPDLLFFVLSGTLCRYNSISPESGKERNSTQWSTMLDLLPSGTPYTSLRSLAETTHAYLQLLAILPIALLQDSQVLSRSTVEAILSRDVGNSFGIWSVQGPPNVGEQPQQPEEDPEMLGYAIYPSASFFNHSCRPNVRKQRIGRSWLFSVATVPVLADEELTITYIRGEEDSLPLMVRRKRLEDGWGFICRCSKCTLEEEEADGTETLSTSISSQLS